MPVVSVRIKAESVKLNWIGVPVLKNIIVRQFYEDLIAGNIIPEVQLNHKDHLQSVKVEFSFNTTGSFNVVSMECNMIEAIEAWRNRVQYYQTDSLILPPSEMSINVFEQMMNNATNFNHLPTFTISEKSNALEKLRYDIVEWIYKNNGGWSKDTAITTGKEFVKDLAAALCRLKKKKEQFDKTMLAYHSNILFKYTRSAWIRRLAFHWLVNLLEQLATNLSQYQEFLQKQLITPNLVRKSHIIDRYQTLVDFLEQSNFWETINIESFLPNKPVPKHQYIKELNNGFPFKVAQYIHDSTHGSS
ncbi:3719_t:CDS:2, partial [Cetraspora pellucida]